MCKTGCLGWHLKGEKEEPGKDRGASGRDKHIPEEREVEEWDSGGREVSLAALTGGQITKGLEGQARTFMSWQQWEGPEGARSKSHLGKVVSNCSGHRVVGRVGDKSVAGRAEGGLS